MVIPDEKIEEIARVIAKSSNLVAFSGAGVSAESEIPTFRDPGGLWDRYDPSQIATTGGLSSLAASRPNIVRQFLQEMLETFEKARPNPGHFALAELEKMGILRSVITQNIDNLHREAGNSYVIEVHGNIYRLRCMGCGEKYMRSREDFSRLLREFLSTPEDSGLADLISHLPKCEKCGNITRPDVVMFGEPVQDFDLAATGARNCDVMLVLGTSGVVYPAASVPVQAKQSGAEIIDINPTQSTFHNIADYIIIEKTGVALPIIVKRVKDIM